MVISRRLFHLQTSYLVPRYNPYLVQLNKVQSMALVPMTLTLVKVKGQGQIFQKMCKKKTQRTGHILDAISPTHFILGYKVQPNTAHSMTQVSMILTKGQATQGQFFPKMGKKKPKNLSYLGGYFTYRLHTWYQVTI